MSDPKQLERSVQAIVVEICDTLQRHGFETVSMGALMRLLGIDDSQAQRHDQHWIDLRDPQGVPGPGHTVH